jgi:16S rRNA U516 pseudouridylate synthase RsuA-like enzyme
LVKVNSEIAHIGQVIDKETDKVELLDKAIEEQKNLVYYKLNKPRGIETTCAQHNTKNIIDIMNVKQRIFPI